MNDTNQPDLARQIDAICDRFEALWQQGQQPDIELFLAEIPKANQRNLLRELVEVDMHYRRLRGEHPAPDEYEARFSQESLFTMPIEKTRATGELDTTSTVIPEKEQVWPHVLIAGYEILGELGKGGMGVVYKARHLRLNRVVALKMIRAGTDAHSEELLRFLNEARAVARLQHPNIVQIFEVGPEDSNSHSAPTFEGF